MQNSNKSAFILYLISYWSVRAGLKPIEATAKDIALELSTLGCLCTHNNFTENNNWARTSWVQLYMWENVCDRIISPVPRIISPVPRIILPVPRIILPVPRIIYLYQSMKVTGHVCVCYGYWFWLCLYDFFYVISDLFRHCGTVCFFHFIFINSNVKSLDDLFRNLWRHDLNVARFLTEWKWIENHTVNFH